MQFGKSRQSASFIVFAILKPDRFEISHFALPGDQNHGSRDLALVYFCLESISQTSQSLRGETNFFGLARLGETLRERGERNERGDSANAKNLAKLHLTPPPIARRCADIIVIV
jgi:hypothetical protein